MATLRHTVRTHDHPGKDSQSAKVPAQIRALLGEQPFAVLCTQGEGQPYGSVVAYAFSDDLKTMTFATPVDTHKYRLLCACDRVALVVDSRAQHPGDLMAAQAITATGKAVQLARGPERDQLARRLATRHPQLEAFVAASTTALFRVDIREYVHVSRFQEVHAWTP